MLELHIDLGVVSELDLVILDLGWSGSGRTGAPGAPVLSLNPLGSSENSLPDLTGHLH